jgi:hypothetical protein
VSARIYSFPTPYPTAREIANELNDRDMLATLDREAMRGLWTTDEVVFVALAGCFVGMMGTVGLAFVWSWFL